MQTITTIMSIALFWTKLQRSYKRTLHLWCCKYIYIYFLFLGQSDHPRSSITESDKWAEWSSGAVGRETAWAWRGASEIRSGYARQANTCWWRRGVQEEDGQRHCTDRWLGRRKNKMDWTEQEIWSTDSKVWFLLECAIFIGRSMSFVGLFSNNDAFSILLLLCCYIVNFVHYHLVTENESWSFETCLEN